MLSVILSIKSCLRLTIVVNHSNRGEKYGTFPTHTYEFLGCRHCRPIGDDSNTIDEEAMPY